MATKELGYIELEWTCPRCQTRNPGTQTTCSGCGAPQPAGVKFDAPAQAELLRDEAKIARARAGPDIQCAFCGTRNPASAAVCKQCGADLAQGTRRSAGDIVGAFQTGPGALAGPAAACTTCGALNPAGARTCSKCGAPLARAQSGLAPDAPSAAQGKASTGWSRMAILGVVVVVGLIALFIFLSFRTSEVVGVVRDARWTRSIPIEGLTPVEYHAWWDEVPQDAAVLSCQEEVRRIQDFPAPNAHEVCGTPYTVDTGTGIGRVVQDCQYEIYEEMCAYTVNEWRVVDVIKASGSGFVPTWPVASLSPRQRLGAGSERYECIIAVGDSWYTYTPGAFDEYLQCKPGSQWRLEVNSFGNLMSIQPVQ
jgi:ribosomal protein L40E